MNKEILDLIKKFEKIKNKGYIKGVTKNKFNSCGLTFEKELGKKMDGSFLPDYNGIEIKCKYSDDKYPITLFTIAFEGPELYEGLYLLEKYGKYNSIVENEWSLFTKLEYKNKIKVNDDYYFELNLDSKKLYINIYDKSKKIIETKGFIYLNTIKRRLNTKFSKLAIIKAEKKERKEELYFKYLDMKLYQLKDPNKFFNLIKLNLIEVSLILRKCNKICSKGRNKSKNMIFNINLKNIDELFDEIKL